MAKSSGIVATDRLARTICTLDELSSSTDHLIMIEYSEPQPLMFLNQGMGAYVVNWINPAVSPSSLSSSSSSTTTTIPEKCKRMMMMMMMMDRSSTL